VLADGRGQGREAAIRDPALDRTHELLVELTSGDPHSHSPTFQSL
jgi:hypothetical protein